MATFITLPPASPLEYARGLNGNFLLLYSQTQSLLFYEPIETLEKPDPSAMRSFLGKKRDRFDTPVAGYIGYPLKNALEALSEDAPSWINAPPVLLVKWRSVLVFKDGIVECHGNPPPAPKTGQSAHIHVSNLQSNMTRSEYLAKVANLIERIHAGELYQANLTRKFFGELDLNGMPLDLFDAFTTISPAPYSAYMKWNDLHILSASPECFLTVDANSKVVSRPIKGTLPRGERPEEDAVNKTALANSAKDKAENLMIVDLMRNDFSKVCTDVHVAKLHEIESFAQVHHMVSTVEGKLKPGANAMDATLACFPPGSMTGAPKIRAMQVCSELEIMSRGIYSGALGWFGGDGSADLSVVIRTLILRNVIARSEATKQSISPSRDMDCRVGLRPPRNDRFNFEFQVGGGIVADSTPEKELAETYAKAAGICELLGITLE